MVTAEISRPSEPTTQQQRGVLRSINPYNGQLLKTFTEMSVDEIDTLLNHRSGLLGLCGANDMREVLRRRANRDSAAALAFDVYCRRITSYVGA